LAGETEVLGEKLPNCYFVHYKSQKIWPEIELGSPDGKLDTYSLSYGTMELVIDGYLVTQV
jgi:hypothetical protein